MQQQPNIDPSKYREAMQMLENEMNKMKSGYEDEINRLRFVSWLKFKLYKGV